MEQFDKSLKEILDHFGLENQIIKCIEEMSEVTKELCKYLTEPEKFDVEDLCDEIADVEIMLAQMCVAFNISSEVIHDVKKQKITKVTRYIKYGELK